ncbi:MAG: hypothetical protein ACETVW_02275 [Dehalococcoidia bacterium]
MTQKLSPNKVSKMMALFFEGYSQTDIANKLKIDQSTVSVYVGKFKSISEQQDMQAAGEEFGIMNQVEALHSLAAELKKAKLAVEEAGVGLKMVQSLEKLGIKQEDYRGVLQACTKMKSEGFIKSAVKLTKLEHSTGMTHGELLDQYATTHEKLKKEQQELETTTSKLNAVKEELANMDKQKKAASQDLKTYMDQIGVDMNRLELVEGLAKTLKDAGISNKELEDYIARQKILNKAGIGFNIFTEIVEKAKVLTSHDQGKGLLKSLSHYGGISEAIKDLQAKVESLEKQAAGLEQLAQQKGKLDAQVVELKAEKVSLESGVAELHKKKDELDNIQSQIGSLTKKMDELEQGIAAREAYDSALTDEIKAKEQKVSDLSQLEAERDALAVSVSKTKAELSHENARLQVFDSFLGFVSSSSIVELEQFVAALPALLDQVKQGQYSPELLRAFIVSKLTGDTLQVLKCPSCGVRFGVDQPPMSYGGYHCPCCYSTSVVTDQQELAILKEALARVKPQIMVAEPVAKQPKLNTHEEKSRE